MPAAHEIGVWLPGSSLLFLHIAHPDFFQLPDASFRPTTRPPLGRHPVLHSAAMKNECLTAGPAALLGPTHEGAGVRLGHDGPFLRGPGNLLHHAALPASVRWLAPQSGADIRRRSWLWRHRRLRAQAPKLWTGTTMSSPGHARSASITPSSWPRRATACLASIWRINGLSGWVWPPRLVVF